MNVDKKWKDEYEDPSSPEFSQLNAEISNNVSNLLITIIQIFTQYKL